METENSLPSNPDLNFDTIKENFFQRREKHFPNQHFSIPEIQTLFNLYRDNIFLKNENRQLEENMKSLMGSTDKLLDEHQLLKETANKLQSNLLN